MRTQLVIACIIIVTLGTTAVLSNQKNNDTTLDQQTRNQKLIGVQYALHDNNIPQAIHSMPTQRASDFYYRAQLHIQQAQILIQQGEQEQAEQWLQATQTDLQQAANKTHNPYLRAHIRQAYQNHQTRDTLQQIQVCFTDFGTLLEDLSNIHTSIQHIINSIKTQQHIIQQNNQQLANIIEPECIDHIQKSMEQTSQTLTITNQHIIQQRYRYQDIYTQYADDPSQCIGTDIKPLLRDTTQTQNDLADLTQTYNLTLQALQLGDPNILNQMCQQAQDDSLSNQSLEQSLQQLLQNLEQSTEIENNDEEQNQESNNQKQQSQQPEARSQKPTYLPLTEEEKTILQQIQETNTHRLETMMQIRSSNYNPRQKLESLFEIFYPDMNQFDTLGR